MDKELDTVKVLNTLGSQVWPAGKPAIKARVVTALGLLIGSKVIFNRCLKMLPILYVTEVNITLFILFESN